MVLSGVDERTRGMLFGFGWFIISPVLLLRVGHDMRYAASYYDEQGQEGSR